MAPDQLSVSIAQLARSDTPDANKMVGLGRLELPTSRLSSARSNQLSYKPEFFRPADRRFARTTAIADARRQRLGARSRRKRKEDGGVLQMDSVILKRPVLM